MTLFAFGFVEFISSFHLYFSFLCLPIFVPSNYACLPSFAMSVKTLNKKKETNGPGDIC